MPRSPALFPLLLLLLPQLAASLGLHGAGGRHPECGPCRPEHCLVPARCPAPGIAARDECGCCALCLGAEGASCGGRAGARCGPGLVCASRATGAAPEGTGLCVCAQRGAVCGSDGRSYPSVCALRLRARHAPRAHLRHLHKARDGPCEFAPVIISPPRNVHNFSGAQVYLSCEVRAVPAPVITWRKVTQSPAGTQVLEELPGDHVNVAVQVRGGPSDHGATAWILINPLKKEDEGVYQCHSANMVGEAQSHGTVTVIELSEYQPNPPPPNSR
ncbi:PREDICTED: insulin-like growth factor-binding protein-like 1 [Chrysochloris asiatica]|uniref:Insulin-like growth factor-binding protein-like 1 n=1 Tax=Chrysochloris asiatica TaxID=185453 RepID=A0A9B0WQH8_CHRAS|nr:PREDICTED: insulin-like growth factor-binding protein-like 1 [Chrysochloris asiatica]